MRANRDLKRAVRTLGRFAWRKAKSRQGNALVETSILLPVLATLLIAAFEIATAAYTSVEVQNAALAGVQYGVQSAATAGDTTGIQTAAANDAPNITLGTTNVSHSCICANGSASTCLPTDCTGSTIITILTVQTQATFTPVIHMPGIPSSFTMYGQAIQRVMQ
jgi:Flp pilus assembly protein TadG